jgi:CRISPR system Cascade subunit CasB
MNETNRFIQHLKTLADDRGALAALRRGLGKPPGTTAEMYPYVVPWLPDEASTWLENNYYLVASLFAYHPDSSSAGNMGHHMARTCATDDDKKSTERRFTVLLAADGDDLPNYLRQTISFLKSKDQSVNWDQLFIDLMGWNHESRYVQRRWANAFWGNRPEFDE